MNNITQREYYVIRSSESKISTALNIDLSKDYDHITISSASVPKTYYVLPSDCALEVDEDGKVNTCNFLKGNYNLKSFAVIFKSVVEGVCLFGYSVNYPLSSTEIDTGKFTFVVDGNFGVQPKMRTSNIYLARVMGIKINVWYTFVSNSLKSVNVVNFQSYDELLIKSNIVKNKENLLQEIYSTGNPYNSSILFQNDNLPLNAKLVNNLTSSEFEFSLQDTDGNLIDLNGSEWSFVICIFKINNIDTIMKRFIEMMLLDSDRQKLE